MSAVLTVLTRPGPLETMAVLARIAETARLCLTHEKTAQAKLEVFFGVETPFHVEREVRLSDGDIVDFMINGVAVEVKLKGAKSTIYRQLVRYAKHESVKGILLVSSVAMGLPPEIEGKPARIASLAQGWLA